MANKPWNKYIRHGVVSIDFVISNITRAKSKRTTVILNGHTYYVNMGSNRYKVFRESQACFCCGLEGKYFALESQDKEGFGTWTAKRDGEKYGKPNYKLTIKRNAHFNLYGIDDSGNEVLLTQDHIKPKSRGGKDGLYNLQTMCYYCNQTRGNGPLIVYGKE